MSSGVVLAASLVALDSIARLPTCSTLPYAQHTAQQLTQPANFPDHDSPGTLDPPPQANKQPGGL